MLGHVLEFDRNNPLARSFLLHCEVYASACLPAAMTPPSTLASANSHVSGSLLHGDVSTWTDATFQLTQTVPY